MVINSGGSQNVNSEYRPNLGGDVKGSINTAVGVWDRTTFSAEEASKAWNDLGKLLNFKNKDAIIYRDEVVLPPQVAVVQQKPRGSLRLESTNVVLKPETSAPSTAVAPVSTLAL